MTASADAATENAIARPPDSGRLRAVRSADGAAKMRWAAFFFRAGKRPKPSI